MAVGQEWTHPQFVSQGEGLTVMGGGLVDVWGLATYGNVAKETVGMRLMATSCVGAGEFEEASGKRACLVHAADEQLCLTQFGERECLIGCAAPGNHALQHLIQERESLGNAPGEGIRRTQGGGDHGEEK